MEESQSAACTPDDFSQFVASVPDERVEPFNPFTLENHPEGLPISLSPGDGWLVEITRKETGYTWTERVVGWVLQSSGTALALCLDDFGGGGTYFPTLADDLKCRVYHPDAPQNEEDPQDGNALQGEDTATA
ncbi:hypothetical protein [Streptomyces cinereoruber]|uniref:hypothetical protein n=1 Tax=Streptomyces cinereoruber TaxID=67260 RepID=UPI0036405B87